MPHIHLDYSQNLASRLDISGLAAALRDAAMSTGVFPLAGLRIRAITADHTLVADGNPDHAYLDVIIRIGAGRDQATKTRAIDAIFAAAARYCQPTMDSSSFMLSMELREIDAQLTRKSSSIRKYLAGDAP